MFLGSSGDGNGGLLGRGGKREKLAGYLRAANELRQTYQNSYMNRDDTYDDKITTADAFPNLKVSHNGTDEMVLFPSYARPHVRSTQQLPDPAVVGGDDLNQDPGDADYWARQWEIHEDANAIVDVDVRGWIYSPARGQLGRRNRLLLSVARRLSGLPAPGESPSPSRASSITREMRDQDEEVERRAREIAAQGEHEADMALRGGFSENPRPSRSNNPNGRESPRPGNLGRPMTDTSLSSNDASSIMSTGSGSGSSNMSTEEIAAANRYLTTRLRPFMTTPVADMTVTIFFYNNETSQSRSARTNESGHFNFRAALAFVPTNVRLLTSEGLSASEEVIVTETNGVSVISDIDDTIKHSAISAGAREIFRNAFIRDLMSLQIEGVKEWYWSMVKQGAKMHYVSNSPWQMFPLLDGYFHDAGLPPGSLHLKEYSGMLQGVFEPVAERKRGTIDRIFSDFPERKFILIGDSGEADLEVYTETALMNPGRVLGIFIRDVTTDPKVAFFDSTLPAGATEGRRNSDRSTSDIGEGRRSAPPLPPRREQLPTRESAPELGDLIDFSEDFEAEAAPKRTGIQTLNDSNSATTASKSRAPAPPNKPHALRVNSSGPSSISGDLPVVGGRPAASASETNLSMNRTDPSSSSSSRKQPAPPPPPPPARRQPPQSTPSTQPSQPSKLSETLHASQQLASSLPPPPSARVSREDEEFKQPPPLPARKPWPGQEHATAAIQYASRKVWSGAESGGTVPQNNADAPASRRIELWNQRWGRAEAALRPKGVLLRTWRVGSDVGRAADELIRNEERKKRKGR